MRLTAMLLMPFLVAVASAQGPRVEVTTGSTLNYKPQGQGFYLMPANAGGNNQRVYVVLAAVRHLRFL